MWTLPVAENMFSSWNFNRILGLVIILRDRATSYDQPFRRYEIRLFWPFFAFFPQKRHFRLSEGYSLWQTLIEKCLFRLKWGVIQLRTTYGSRDMTFHPVEVGTGNRRGCGPQGWSKFLPLLLFENLMVYIVCMDIFKKSSQTEQSWYIPSPLVNIFSGC